MSKKYTAAEMKEVLMSVLSNALYNMDAMNNILRPFNGKKMEDLSPEDAKKVERASLILTILNDVIHPAHKFCYSSFAGNDKLFDYYVQQQTNAFKLAMINPCLCRQCKDGLYAGVKQENPVAQVNQESSEEVHDTDKTRSTDQAGSI